MGKYRELGLKFIYPNILVFILIFILGFGSVIWIFLNELTDHFISYVIYVLSFYALILTVFRGIKLYKWINKKIHGNKYMNMFISNRELKNNINLFSGTFFNIIYGIFKFITGFIYSSIWFGATGVYYLILGLMKLSLIKYAVKRVDNYKKIRQYRNIGIFMFLLNSAMVGMIILMIRDGNSMIYPGYIIYAQAAYTFYILTFAIINMVRYKRNQMPIIAASKAINLVAAIMSLFILQVSMINQFGGNEMFSDIINTTTGTMTSFVTIGIAIYMTVNSKVHE